MFNYIRRKIVGKNEDATTNSPEASRTRPSDQNNTRAGTKPAQASNEIRENENATLTRKDVVNLLIPPTDYSSHKTGVTAILHNIMAGSRKRNRSKHKNRHKNKNQIIRAESYKEISTEVPEDMQINVNLYRSHSQLDKPYASREETLSAPVSASDLTYDVVEAKNNFANELINSNETHANSPADFVKELVLHKYKNKTETKRPHVSLIYVSNEQGGEQINNAIDSDLYETIAVSQTQLVGQEAERQHALTESIPNTIDKQYKDAKQALLNEDPAKHRAEALLKEIAKRIDYKLNDKTESMGADASKNNDEKYRNNIDHKHENEAKTTSMNAFKDSLKNELDNLLQSDQAETVLHEKPGYENPVYHEVPKSAIEESLIREKEEVCLDIENEKLKFFEPQKTESDIEDQQMLECLENRKKSNLKPPRSDTEGCSDDDRSDCGRKKVTFKKVIHFDDGDQQTDEEIDSSFGSLASSEEEEEESDSELPDNDELLGGVVVTRAEDKVVITEIADDEENYLNSNFNAIIDFVDETDDLKISETPDHFNELEKSAKTKFETDLSEHKFKSSDDIQDLNTDSKVKSDCETDIHRINSDNSDSGFIEFNEKADVKEAEESVTDSDGETEEVTDSEEEEEDEESSEGGVVIAEVVEQEDLERDDLKTLVTQEDKFQAQVAQLSELANTRCGEAERVREQLARHRKEIESRDQEIERLKCDLAAAYKESELIRQRSRSLEDDLAAAKSCSAHLAEKLARYNDGTERALRAELEAAQSRAAELESRLLALEKEKARLEHEKQFQEQKALEALEAAEASSARWKSAHEAARSQAAARAERLLADCEWKMRELEKRAREADKQKTELTAALQKAQSETPSAAQQAELQQLRGFASEQQRSVQALTAQLQRLETREDALKVEVHRLKELLEREAAIAREKEERQAQALSRLEQSHAKRIESVRSELSAQQAATRSALERAHAERTRNALAQLRLEHERDCRNAERKLREAQARFDNLKEVLASKESQFEESIAEAHSKADWELLQLRHLLDKTDIAYANKIEEATEKHESEIERLNAEWSGRLEQAEQAAASAAGEAKSLLESTRARLEAERVEQVNRLKEEHRIAMEEQWEQFMSDKEAGLARMKLECRQEGEEERSRRERDLLDEIADLKSQIESKSASFDELADKAASCGRTLAVTEQELREALEREKLLRMQRSEDSDKIKQAKNASRNEVEHLTRKCACLRKLFDDMRTRLAAREKVTAEESRAQQREIQQLKAEVARLTKILVEQSSPKLGARTRADGCDSAPITDESFFSKAGLQASESQPSAPRRKGGTLRTPELPRKRSNTAELKTLANMMENMRPTGQDAVGRRRAKSVDLPAVQVPVRIKQLEDRNK